MIHLLATAPAVARPRVCGGGRSAAGRGGRVARHDDAPALSQTAPGDPETIAPLARSDEVSPTGGESGFYKCLGRLLRGAAPHSRRPAGGLSDTSWMRIMARRCKASAHATTRCTASRPSASRATTPTSCATRPAWPRPCLRPADFTLYRIRSSPTGPQPRPSRGHLVPLRTQGVRDHPLSGPWAGRMTACPSPARRHPPRPVARRNQPRPSSVRRAGRYSQPTQPS